MSRLHVLRFLTVLIFILALEGCVFQLEISKTALAYPTAEKLPLRIGLVISESLRNAQWEGQINALDSMRSDLGDALAYYATETAKAAFSEVMVLTPGSTDGRETVDALLTPRLVSLERTRPMFINQDAVATISLEWRLESTSGDLIWLDTVKAENKHTLGFPVSTNAEEQLTDLIQLAFLKSYEKIKKSPEIRAFAAGTSLFLPPSRILDFAIDDTEGHVEIACRISNPQGGRLEVLSRYHNGPIRCL
jgi:hypothetical protein